MAFEGYWYLGLTQTYRANAAYSLYGVLAGQKDKGCEANTFINSFFTNYGAQHFVEAVQMNGGLGGYANNNGNGGAFDGFSSSCAAQVNDEAIDDMLYNVPEYGESAFPNSYSYTLGCSEYDTFEQQTFTGATCDGQQYLETTSTEDQANTYLENMGCALLYDSSTKYTDDGQWGGYVAEYDDQFWDTFANKGWGQYGEDGDEVPELVHPLDLLKYSHTCSIVLFGSKCPDPFGKVAEYLDALKRGTRTNIILDDENSWRNRNLPWIVLVVLGFMMMIASLAVDGKLNPRKWDLTPKAFGVEEDSGMGRTIKTFRARFISIVGQDKQVVLDTSDPSAAVKHAMSLDPQRSTVASNPSRVQESLKQPLDNEISKTEMLLDALKQKKTAKSNQAPPPAMTGSNIPLSPVAPTTGSEIPLAGATEAPTQTPQARESTFGAFGAMMGLETPQRDVQGTDGKQAPTFPDLN